MNKLCLTIFLSIILVPASSLAQIPDKEYYPNGDIKVDWYSEFDDNDLTRKEYYPNNILKNEANYENGKIEGVYKEYDQEGNLLIELGYKGGLEHGNFKEYTAYGSIIKEGQYSHGKLDGRQISYDINGNIYQDIVFVDGKKHGHSKLYYEGGNPKEISTYSNGQLTGELKLFNPQGVVIAQSNYHNGLRHGAANEYYPSGNLRVKMNFVNDKLDGELLEYYENQTLKKKTILNKGELVKQEAYDGQGALVPNLTFGNAAQQTSSDKNSDALNQVFERRSRVDPSSQNSGFINILLIGFLIIVFLLVGIYVGKILSLSKKEDTEYKKNLTYMKEEKSRRIEFNALHSESEKMYRSLIETVKSGIFMADAKGHIFYGNHTFAKIFGHKSKQDVIGLNANKLFCCIDHAEKKLLKVMGEDNEIQDFQFNYRLNNNDIIVLSVSANRVFDDKGVASGLQGVVIDITEKKELEKDVLNEKRKLESILGFFEDIESIREQDKLIDFSVKGIAEILEVKTCIIAVQKSDSEDMSVLGADGLDVQSPERMTIDMTNPINLYVKKMERLLYVENIEYDKRFMNIEKPIYLNRSFIIVPLSIEDKFNGMIIVSKKESKFGAEIPFTEVDKKVLTIIATKVSTAMENISLFNDLNLQTVIDPITKIYNYRLLSETLDREIHRYKREKNLFFVLMMDVDDFKSYNDTYGHLEGDELLRNLGMILSSNVRETDVACRYAGDEFCVVLTNTTVEGAITPAKKIVKAVEEFEFKRTVTISIGIAAYEEGMTKKEIISKADKALYEAKYAGKNNYVLSS